MGSLIPTIRAISRWQAVHDGMTLRDYFAGQALAGLCAYGIPGEHHTPEATAEDAYAYADAMLAEREK
jgi:hypothetical protein